MKKIIREFLTFSRTEQRGIFFLCLVITGLNSVRLILPFFESPVYPLSIPDQKILAGWVSIRENDTVSNTYRYTRKEPRRQTRLFKFDPNTLPEAGWLELGFTEKEAASIAKFRKRGAVFRKKEDLKKLYCMTDAKFTELEPYVLLSIQAEQKKWEKPAIQPKHYQKPAKIELNAADTIALDGLKGIGMFRAKKIYQYRERLGGFYSVDQLLEIKGFPDSLLELVSEQVTLDTTLIRKLNINSISAEDLQKHPYCWYGIGKTIVNYRSKHGAFLKSGDLLKIYSLKPEVYEKLRHYISLE